MDPPRCGVPGLAGDSLCPGLPQRSLLAAGRALGSRPALRSFHLGLSRLRNLRAGSDPVLGAAVCGAAAPGAGVAIQNQDGGRGFGAVAAARTGVVLVELCAGQPHAGQMVPAPAGDRARRRALHRRAVAARARGSRTRAGRNPGSKRRPAEPVGPRRSGRLARRAGQPEPVPQAALGGGAECLRPANCNLCPAGEPHRLTATHSPAAGRTDRLCLHNLGGGRRQPLQLRPRSHRNAGGRMAGSADCGSAVGR